MNVFIIGAGFTKAVFPNAPLNGELLDALALKDSHSAARELLGRYQTKDIEIALTKLDTDLAQAGAGNNADLQNLRKRIEAELGKYFGISEQLGDNAPCQFSVSNNLFTNMHWLARFVGDAIRPEDVAISLNYDCVLEGALDRCGKWSPNGGYGFPFDPPPGSDSFPKSPVTVIKIHGSASFLSAPYIDKPDARHVGFYFVEQFFPRSAENKHYGLANGQTYLIAPSYVKVPAVEISYLMIEALQATTKADNLVVIGCSLRPEDIFLTVLHTNFLHQPSGRDRKIIVIDPEAQAIKGRLENYWGVNVASQIVTIPKSLEVSVEDLLKLISGASS